jgi:hypothetical protein
MARIDTSALHTTQDVERQLFTKAAFLKADIHESYDKRQLATVIFDNAD